MAFCCHTTCAVAPGASGIPPTSLRNLSLRRLRNLSCVSGISPVPSESLRNLSGKNSGIPWRAAVSRVRGVAQEAILEKAVDAVWRARVGRGDPFQEPLHAARVEQHMDGWVAGQVVKIDDKKWGSKVSQKLFVDREYVLKHIRNKHGHLLEAERDQVGGRSARRPAMACWRSATIFGRRCSRGNCSDSPGRRFERNVAHRSHACPAVPWQQAGGEGADLGAI